MDNRRRVIGITVAIVLAIIGTIGLVAYVRGAEDRALAGEELVNVLVMTQPVEAGTSADELAGKTKQERVPDKVRPEGAVTRLSELRGYVAAVDLVPGEQLIKDRFVLPGTGRTGLGGIAVPRGLFETTMALEPERALGGLVRAGDRVSVVASFDEGASGVRPSSEVVLNGVLVTNVQIEGDIKGADTGSSSDKSNEDVTDAPEGRFLVTMAVDQPALEAVVYAAEHGTIWLASTPLQSP